MSNVNAPRGFMPRMYADGRPFNGAFQSYPIASAYSSNIFTGDPVILSAGKLHVATAQLQIRGIFVGCTAILATASASSPIQLPYWPASSATVGGVDAMGYVIDDPNVLFEAQFTNSTSVPAVGDEGKYFYMYAGAGGNTASGQSSFGIDYSTATATSTLGNWRFVKFPVRPINDTASAYSRGLFMPTLHDYRVNSGAV